ncbi:MAG: hypothetical protein RI842_09790 [Schleiferiaceae bacterium]|nr:hypothetical protein [Schleiferiaceae bacterium]
MYKQLSIAVFIITSMYNLKAQVYHEVGLRFSGMGILEMTPPDYLTEDLDYYLNPQLSYQIHFLNEKLIAGTQIGWVYEKGLKNKENYFREDKRKSVNLDIELGLNILEFYNGLLLATIGTRLSKSYFFKRRIEDGGVAVTTNNSWQEIQYDFTSAVSYQLFLNNKRNPMALRFSWEVVFPRKSFRVNLSGDKLSSIATGPAVSLIWRIKQRRNRGLF